MTVLPVRCSIYVAREGHRGIILGKGGKTIGRIGTTARKLEDVLERRIHLFTHIKYRKDWMNDPYVIKTGISTLTPDRKPMPEWNDRGLSYPFVLMRKRQRL